MSTYGRFVPLVALRYSFGVFLIELQSRNMQVLHVPSSYNKKFPADSWNT